ncbi:uncharacterized protein LOC129718236 isoform X2 [Wyeomyia smithii]|uniref:uncharacterized protein LOC129718236 isoform X2 n=1 Tax=Wyeomyia smithii TaxID=174621 RepID=UPI00246816C8|nr:uncharacterized protein LOC129718236 isoform X2 [Wyeomyia smithii]
MNDCNLGLYELLTFDVEDLHNHLEPFGISWSYDNLYEKTNVWRKRNKIAIQQILTGDTTNGSPILSTKRELETCEIPVSGCYVLSNFYYNFSYVFATRILARSGSSLLVSWWIIHWADFQPTYGH